MPQIRPYVSTEGFEGLHPSELGIEAEAQEGRRVGIAYHQIGQDINQVGAVGKEIGEKIQQHTDVMETAGVTSGMESTQAQQDQEANQALAKNVPVEDYVRDTWEPAMQKNGDNLTSDRARAHYQEMLGAYRHAAYKDYITKQNQNDQDAIHVSASNSVQQLGIASHDHPEAAEDNFNKANVAMQGLFAAADAKGTAISPADRQDAATKLANASADGALDGGLKLLKSNPGVTPQAVDDYIAHIEDPKSFIHQHATEKAYDNAHDAALQIKAGIGDIQAALFATHVEDWGTAVRGNGPDAAAAYQNMTLAADGLARSGKKEDVLKAQGIINKRDDDEGYRQGSMQVNNLSQTDAASLVAGLPAEGGRNHVQQGIFQASKQRDEGMKSDPVNWLTTNDPIVGSRAATYAQKPTPENFASYAVALVAKEQKYDPAAIPKVLPTAAVQEVQGELNAVDQTPTGALKVGQTLEKLRQTTGPYFNYAAHELQAAGVLKGGQFGFAQMLGTPSGYAIAQEGIRAEAIPEKVRIDTSGVTTEKAEGAARAAIAPLAATFADTANGHELIDSYIKGAAAILQARGPGHLGDAQALLNTMVNDRFNVRNHLRIPKSFDDHDVANGADIVQAGIDKHDIQPPPSFSGMGQALQKDTYVQDLKDYGYWSTSDRGDSAVLHYQGLPVYEKIKNGQSVPVEIPFKDLEGVGRNNRSLYDQTRRLATAPQTLGGKPTDVVPSIVSDVSAAAGLIGKLP